MVGLFVGLLVVGLLVGLIVGLIVGLLVGLCVGFIVGGMTGFTAGDGLTDIIIIILRSRERPTDSLALPVPTTSGNALAKGNAAMAVNTSFNLGRTIMASTVELKSCIGDQSGTGWQSGDGHGTKFTVHGAQCAEPNE
jgi:hypothetical protein